MGSVEQQIDNSVVQNSVVGNSAVENMACICVFIPGLNTCSEHRVKSCGKSLLDSLLHLGSLLHCQVEWTYYINSFLYDAYVV